MVRGKNSNNSFNAYFDDKNVLESFIWYDCQEILAYLYPWSNINV